MKIKFLRTISGLAFITLSVYSTTTLGMDLKERQEIVSTQLQLHESLNLVNGKNSDTFYKAIENTKTTTEWIVFDVMNSDTISYSSPKEYCLELNKDANNAKHKW